MSGGLASDDDVTGDDDTTADPCDQDSDGDGFDDCEDPTPYGYSGPEDREASLSMALHIHGSLSEKDGTMAFHTAEADGYDIDVIWWSDHDSMILMLDRQGGYDFDGGALTQDVPIMGATGTHGFSVEGDDVHQSVSHIEEGGPTGSGYYWNLAGQSLGSELWSYLSYIYDADAFMHHVPLMANATASIDIRPYQPVGDDWEMRFSFELSGNFGGTRNVIVYHVGQDDLTEHNADDTLYVPLSAAVSAGEWTTLTFPLTEDAEYFYEREDQGSHGYLFQLGVRRGAQAAVDLDNFVLSWQVDGEELLQLQRDMLAERYSYSDVVHFVGYEMTPIVEGRHVNALALDPPLYSYPELELIGPDDAAEYVHQHDGVAVCNHPFGIKTSPMPPAEEQDASVIEHLQETWLPNDAFGCDALEIYIARGLDLDHHLMFWDELAAHGHFITGVGTTDQHIAKEQPQKLDLLIAQTPTLGDPTSIPAAS